MPQPPLWHGQGQGLGEAIPLVSIPPVQWQQWLQRAALSLNCRASPVQGVVVGVGALGEADLGGCEKGAVWQAGEAERLDWRQSVNPLSALDL